MRLPRSGPELLQRIAERWRWFLYRVRFHPWTTNELPRILGTFGDYIDLTRLNRPIGIWLLLWPTLWAVWIAGRGKPDPRIFIIFVTGTVLMRSAGCAVNDYADRSFDPHVVVAIHHGVYGVVDGDPDHVGDDEEPGHRRHMVELGREGHGDAPAERDAEVHLRHREKALDERIGHRQECAAEGEQQRELVELQDQRQGGERQHPEQDQRLGGGDAPRGQRPVGRGVAPGL